MIIPELLTAAARKFPEKPAAIFPTEQISFAELDLESSKVAGRLNRIGIGAGDRVAFLCENSLAALVTYWGVMKCGAASVDISTLAGVESITEVLEECSAAAIVISPRQFRRMVPDGVPPGFPPIVFSEAESASITEGTGLSHHLLDEISATEEPLETGSPAGKHDVAMIVYTSGTTGRPKGVMLSHDNLISNISSANSLVGLTGEDSILVVVPLYYIHGRMQLLTHALIGGTLVFSAGFHMPQQVLNELVEHRVTGFSGVPYHFKILLERSAIKTTPLPDLKYVLITGGALDSPELRELSDALPGVGIHLAYGQTEASPRITYLSPSEVLSRPDSCGRALLGVVVEIIGEDGLPVPEGKIGEVVASGPNIMIGYVSGDDRASGVIDASGRLHTGDLGRVDSDGYLVLVGRKSQMIKIAGERIFPGEIEEVINSHSAVRESTVIGTTDPILGEKMVAFVVYEDGDNISSEEIRSHCLGFLPFVRVPREVRMIKTLPKTGSGKPDRRALHDLLDA